MPRSEDEWPSQVASSAALSIDFPASKVAVCSFNQGLPVLPVMYLAKLPTGLDLLIHVCWQWQHDGLAKTSMDTPPDGHMFH
jgi:hypothetical protein